MSRILGLAIILLLAYIKVLVWAQDVSEEIYLFSVVSNQTVSPQLELAAHLIYGILLWGSAAENVFKYRTDEVLLAFELKTTQMVTMDSIPSVDFNADPDSFYTLAMVDPDISSRNLPLHREFLHWLVGNIPGSDVPSGDTLAPWVPPTPPPASDPHRYVFFAYKQPGRIEFDKSLLDFTTNELRANTSISKFAMQYGLGTTPLFGCFVQVGI